MISIIAVVQRNHITVGFVVLNYALVIDGIMIIVIGVFVWFFTLRERDNFHKLWLELTSAERLTLQDQLQCCGYFDASDAVEIGGSFCNQTQVDFLNTLDSADDNNAKFFCVSPVTSFADMTLNNVFTCVLGIGATSRCLLIDSRIGRYSVSWPLSSA